MLTYTMSDIFKQNKYTSLYYKIIGKAKVRAVNDSYIEKHHIVPKSLGGNNLVSNIVSLSAREHFICHWLLTKMTTGQHTFKMKCALKMLSTTNKPQRYHTKITSRVYEKNRQQFAQDAKIYWASKSEKEKTKFSKKMSDLALNRTDNIKKEIANKRKDAYNQRTDKDWNSIVTKRKISLANRSKEEVGLASQKMKDAHRNRSEGQKADAELKRLATLENKSQKEKDATQRKRSIAVKGRKHFNNGKIGIMCLPGFEPTNFVPGRLQNV